jgi:hypothetical protein
MYQGKYYEWRDYNWREWHRLPVKQHMRLVSKTTAHIVKLINEGAEDGFDWEVRKLNDLFGDDDRIAGLLPILEILPSDLFWGVWHFVWNGSHRTWAYHRTLLRLLRKHNYCSPARKFDGLEPVTIYRGCNRRRVLGGLAWSTNRNVAAKFAYGLLGHEVPDPVIVTAQIERCDVFDYINSYDEDELVVDPVKLKILNVENFRDNRDELNAFADSLLA